jgi:hypothetical protein
MQQWLIVKMLIIHIQNQYVLQINIQNNKGEDMINWRVVLIVAVGTLVAAWFLYGIGKATEDLTREIASGINNMYSQD